MLFYNFHSDVYAKVYASKIINSADILHKCSKCGRDYFRKDADIKLQIDEKGKYPDALLCGHWPILIISDRALSEWKVNDIKGYKSSPVRLYRKSGEEILSEEALYHYIEITGKHELDLKAMDVKIKSECNKCGAVQYSKETWQFGKAIAKEGKWDGSDLFTFKHFSFSGFCTIKNLEIIYKNKLTNFSIQEFKDMFNYGAPHAKLKDILK